MIRFGGKTLVALLSMLLLSQTTNLLIVANLGANALAVYARPGALLRHVSMLINKYGYVLTPTASSLLATGRRSELAGLLIASSRFSTGLAMPAALFFAVMGGPILQVWMGPDYAAGELVACLAIGSLIPLSQSCVWHVLVGLDSHGRPAIAGLLAAALGSVAIWFGLSHLHMGLTGAAIVSGLVASLATGLYLVRRACQELDLPVRSYLAATWGQPIRSNLPFLAILVTARYVLRGSPQAALGVGVVCGGPVLAYRMWRDALPASVKQNLRDLVTRVLARIR